MFRTSFGILAAGPISLVLKVNASIGQSMCFRFKPQAPPEGGVCGFSGEAAHSCTIDKDILSLDVSMQTIFPLVVDLTAASTLIA